MAGCSVVLFALIMLGLLPAFWLVTIAVMVTQAAFAWVGGPAFPFFLLCVICYALALADVLRIAWHWYHEREALELVVRLLVRPAVLCALGFVASIVMVALTGGQLLDWWNQMAQSSPSSYVPLARMLA